ncbi:hypothetical protein [Methylobacterium sp. 22177]|uniref:hypothetical protein n=1 Tax=Methylobacterium sp. 22177 TaxID=3453885 RepID=UPI003F82F6C1
MKNPINQSELQIVLRDYLSSVAEGRWFEGGAYVVAQDDRLIIEHEEGWSAIATAGSLPVVLDYSLDGIFTGEAGWVALLDWLRP